MRSPRPRDVPWEALPLADSGLLFNEGLVDLVQVGVAEEKRRAKIVGWGEAVQSGP